MKKTTKRLLSSLKKAKRITQAKPKPDPTAARIREWKAKSEAKAREIDPYFIMANNAFFQTIKKGQQ